MSIYIYIPNIWCIIQQEISWVQQSCWAKAYSLDRVNSQCAKSIKMSDLSNQTAFGELGCFLNFSPCSLQIIWCLFISIQDYLNLSVSQLSASKLFVNNYNQLRFPPCQCHATAFTSHIKPDNQARRFTIIQNGFLTMV